MRNVVAVLLMAWAGAMSGCTGGSTSPSDDSPPAPVTWSIYFAGRGLDVSACSPGITFCSGGLNVDANGAFHEVWSSLTPNMLDVTGTLTATGVSATLRCVPTAATGSLSAVPNGAEYTGTATLSGSTVAIRVVKATGPC